MTDSPESTGRTDANSLRLSFEFFPPRTASGQESLGRVAQRLGELNPDFYSCTYGAGGSTREGTKDTITRLIQQGLSAAPHLSIGGDSRADSFSLLDYYRDIGVKRIVALRGDLPSGIGRAGFSHNAETLVGWIREHSADHFHLEVAAYPETHPDAKSPAADLEFFKAKVDAGANSAITQYFYNVNAYYDFIDRSTAAGIQIPIYPGIMPITNYEGLIRVSEKCGTDVPRWIRKHLQAFADDEASLKQFGVEVVTRLCEDLLNAGAPGLHFYTLNRWGASRTICHNLGLSARAA